MKYVVITGVSSGIGRATTAELIEHGYQVFGSVRKEKDAAEAQARFGPAFTPLIFDVTDEAAVKAAAEKTSALLSGRRLAGLVNNAGIGGGGGPLLYQPMDEFRRSFEVNVFGVFAVTQAFLPLLMGGPSPSEQPGRIINLSSVGGKIAFPFLGAYAGSKHALEAMSDALRRELMLFGIDVIVIEPGSVSTDIWDKAEQVDISRYAQTGYAPILARMRQEFIKSGRTGLKAEVVGRTIRQALESAHPKTRYALPDNWITGWVLPRMLPDRWLDRIVAARTGLKRSDK
jgi:NAD(P)-dependent dehydrogenase (short-subunit alcohol dehydrogenase family)